MRTMRMPSSPERARRSIRLAGYDYASPGAYFVTLCVADGQLLFGQVVDGAMVLSGFGQVAEAEWQRTGQLRPYVTLDSYVVMPNHFHAILWLEPPMSDTPRRGTARYAPTPGPVSTRCAPTPGPTSTRCAPTRQFGQMEPASLPAIMRAFKSAVTNRINRQRGTPGGTVWQRNYWEHVVRSERALDAIRRYIEGNALRWELDRFHPTPAGRDPHAADLWRLLQDDVQIPPGCPLRPREPAPHSR
jgi:putative transposase